MGCNCGGSTKAGTKPPRGLNGPLGPQFTWEGPPRPSNAPPPKKA